MKIIRIVFYILLLVFLNFQVVAGEEWKTFHGRTVTIRYHDEDQIRVLSKKIRLDFLDKKQVNIFQSTLPKGKDSLYNQLEAKIETILKKVQFLLDMHPRKRVHFTIQIYSNQKELDQYYSSQYGIGESLLAFYDAEDDAVYLSLKDINERILAHEMAHMVIDKSFHVKLPMRVQEILAQYVDMHLND